MQAIMPTDIDLSIAQVEAELQAAEAYLTAATSTGRHDGLASGQTPATSPPYEQTMRQSMEETTTSFPQRSTRTRALIPDERRKEILAKLSSERQAAVRSHARNTVLSADENAFKEDHLDEYSPSAQIDSCGPSRVMRVGDTEYYDDTDFGMHGDEKESDDEFQDAFDDDGDDGEVFYASDVIGRPVNEDIQPRTALDLFNTDKNHDEDSPSPRPSLQNAMRTTSYEAEDELKDTNDADIHISRVLAPAAMAETKRKAVFTEPESNQSMQPTNHRYDSHDAVKHHENDKERYGDETSLWENDRIHERTGNRTVTTSRLESLAQPRTRVYAEREKQRLVNEMKALDECTFQPALLKLNKSAQQLPKKTDSQIAKETKVARFAGSNTAGTRFPWLTLSPRKQSTRRESSRGRQTLLDRLNLDVTVKYEARERLREMLEAEKMRECTFQPKLNPTSRKLLSRTDYKPIYDRIDEVQREKTEYIQRVREELAYEEGAFTFTPQINPRSREIADAVLSERQISKIRASSRRIRLDDERHLQEMLRPPAVTERLIQDAEQIAQKRVAVQEYYDALEEKSFTPAINEASNRIIEGRPEFKLDFISRQEYFRMVEQEKFEQLEDVVHHEQELTFRPNIGNAKKVLREVRPDLVQETSQQRLDRLVYREPRRKEMVKQKLRDDAYSQLPFKPEINSVSKALVEKARAEAVSKVSRRHELQRYFAGKQFRSRVAKELEQAERAECTFRPQLIARPKVKCSSTSKLQVKERKQGDRSIWRSDTILHTIETQRQQRAEELEAKRNALELKELENCTFQPNVHRPSRRAHSDAGMREEKPVVVRGLGRFLELKERAKRQQEEKKQREEKVFNPNYSYEPRSYTVPKPFKLSEASKDSIRRRLKLREEMRSKEQTECTFAPRTLEAQQRQVLRALLKD